MRFDVATLFPEIFSGYLSQSLLSKAIDRGLVEVVLHDIRAWSTDKHRRVDDRPFGGGPGMLIAAPPVVDCVEAIQTKAAGPARTIMLSPQGRRLDQRLVDELSRESRLILICGRYEGIDQRAIDILQADEISIGDFVLNGGEVAAMAVIDATIRYVPGVLGDEESCRQDSFSSDPKRLEAPQYTRPREYRGLEPPEVLLSGDHQAIARWRAETSQRRTEELRPDLGGEAETNK
jgi:tRNA (guanine37-N1)-methyltransferase